MTTATPTTKKPAVKKTAAVEPTVESTVKTAKPRGWAERLALMTAKEQAEARAKASLASRQSRARKAGTTLEAIAITRLERTVDRHNAKLAQLTAERDEAVARLEAAKEEMETTNDEA